MRWLSFCTSTLALRDVERRQRAEDREGYVPIIAHSLCFNRLVFVPFVNVAARFMAYVHQERKSHAKYLVQANYVGEGIKGLLKEGGSKSGAAAVEKLAKSLGGTIESFYYAFGETDVWRHRGLSRLTPLLRRSPCRSSLPLEQLPARRPC